MKRLMLMAWMCLGAVACGSSDEETEPETPDSLHKGTVSGSVEGMSFGEVEAAWTRSAREYILMGEKLVGDAECLDPRAAPAILSIAFNGGLRAGTHAVVGFSEAERTNGTYVSVESASVDAFATGGTVTVTKDGARWTGSFTVEFEGERLTGTFETEGPALTALCP